MPVREFRWQMSERQWAYLQWLVKNTSLGRTEKDVAQYLLTQKIQEMRTRAICRTATGKLRILSE